MSPEEFLSCALHALLLARVGYDCTLQYHNAVQHWNTVLGIMKFVNTPSSTLAVGVTAHNDAIGLVALAYWRITRPTISR